MEFRTYGADVLARLTVSTWLVTLDDEDMEHIANVTGFDRDQPYMIGVLTEPFGVHLAGATVLQTTEAGRIVLYIQV